MLEALDPRVFIIVSLRKRGQAEDEISALTNLYDSVDSSVQKNIANFIAREDEDIVKALVGTLPAVHESLMKGDGETPAQIIEKAVSKLED